MKGISRFWMVLVVSVALGMTLWTSSVRATPITYWIGETQFDDIGWVDWLVLWPGDYGGTDFANLVLALVSDTELELYAYLYQIESAQEDTDQLTVRPLGPWSEIGKLNLDLDNWHNLPGENEPSEQKLLVEPYYIDPTPRSPSWNFAKQPTGKGLVGVGEESWVLFILSPMPPTFNNAILTNSGDSRKPLPVPSPEPTMGLLLLIGAAGLAIYRRRLS